MEKLNNLVLKLIDKYKEYRTILSDGFERPPVFADGYALNMVRKEIISLKEEILELCINNNLDIPFEYNFEIPKEVAENFMANHKRIISDANWLADKLMPLYNTLIEKVQFVSNEIRGRSEYSYLVKIYPDLIKAIDNDDYYNMRRLSVCFNKTVENRYEDLSRAFNRTFEYFDENQQDQVGFVA